MAKQELLCCGLLRAAGSVGPTAGPRAPSVPVLPRPLPARCRLFILLGRRLEAGEMEASGHRLEGGRPHGPGPTCKTRCALCVAISVIPQMCPHVCGRRRRGRGERKEGEEEEKSPPEKRKPRQGAGPRRHLPEFRHHRCFDERQLLCHGLVCDKHRLWQEPHPEISSAV